MNNFVYTTDTYGNMCVGVRNNSYFALDIASRLVRSTFHLDRTCFGDGVYINSQWMRWYGAFSGTPEIRCVELASGDVRWTSRIASIVDTLIGDPQSQRVAALTLDNHLVYLDADTGGVLETVHDTSNMWRINERGDVCTQAQSDKSLRVRWKRGIVPLDCTARMRTDDVMCIAATDDLIAVSWLGGGITFFSCDTGKLCFELPKSVWLTRFAWNPVLGVIVGFGSLDSHDDSMLVEIAPTDRRVERVMLKLPDQREYVCGRIALNGNAAVLHNGYVWDFINKCSYPIPIPSLQE